MDDTISEPGKTTHARRRRTLTAEIWQFLIVVSVFFVVAPLWLFVVYLPGRTLERWEDQPPGRGDKGAG
jgi:hypothetical protein